MKWTCAVAAAMVMVAPAVAQADSIPAVEHARAIERQGGYLSPQDREQLRRYGGNDDYGYSGYGAYGYDGGYYSGGYAGGYDGDDYEYGPGVSIYVGD